MSLVVWWWSFVQWLTQLFFFFFLSSTSLALPILEWLAALLILDILSDECCRRILRSTNTHTMNNYRVTVRHLQWKWILRAEKWSLQFYNSVCCRFISPLKLLLYYLSMKFKLSILQLFLQLFYRALSVTLSWKQRKMYNTFTQKMLVSNFTSH